MSTLRPSLADAFAAQLPRIAVASCAAALLSGCYTVDSFVDAPDANPGDGICARAPGLHEQHAGVRAVAPDPEIMRLRAQLSNARLTRAEREAIDRGEFEVVARRPELARTRTDALSLIDNRRIPSPVRNGGELVASNGGLCTLRAAIMEANATAFRSQILVPPGTYHLTLPHAPGGAGGSLLIERGMRIQGSGAAQTVIAGDSIHSVFHIDAPASAGNVELNLMTVRDGYAQGGGGLRIKRGTVELEDLVVRDNGAFTGGAGMLVDPDAIVTVRRTTMHDNVATGLAGGAIWNMGQLWLYDSTLTANQSNRAGAIHNESTGQLNLRNVTISGNRADLDDIGGASGTGGIHNNGFLVLNNATITGNEGTADRAGGLYTTAGATTHMTNSIVAGNDAMGGSADCKGTLAGSSKFNLIGSAAGCVIVSHVSTFLLDVPANLGPLQSNLGPTQTHIPLAGSPARDAAYAFPPPAVDACEPADQRGVPRPQGGRCDLGAVEYTDASLDVTGFVLVDAATDTDIRPLRNDDWLVLSQLPAQLSIRAVVNGAPGSVVFDFSGAPALQTENAAPYALAGDASGDYTPVALSGGEHVLSATPFAGPNGSGSAGAAHTIRFNVLRVER